jgi:hypothetical protein
VPEAAFQVRVAVEVVAGGGDEVMGEIVNVTGTVNVHQVPILMVILAL